MPAGVGYGPSGKKGQRVKNKAGLMRKVNASTTKGTHERALNAAFEMARRKKKR